MKNHWMKSANIFEEILLNENRNAPSIFIYRRSIQFRHYSKSICTASSQLFFPFDLCPFDPWREFFKKNVPLDGLSVAGDHRPGDRLYPEPSIGRKKSYYAYRKILSESNILGIVFHSGVIVSSPNML